MYERHPVFEEPIEEATLWRYMSLGRLISLLSHQALYFCRVDRLQDVKAAIVEKERVIPE